MELASVVRSSGQPRYRAVAEVIRQRIARGELGPGEMLPTQKELARQAGVDVGTITKAISLLIRERVLLKPNRGTRAVVTCPPSKAHRAEAKQAKVEWRGRLLLHATVRKIRRLGTKVQVYLDTEGGEVLSIPAPIDAIAGSRLNTGSTAIIEFDAGLIGLANRWE